MNQPNVIRAALAAAVVGAVAVVITSATKGGDKDGDLTSDKRPPLITVSKGTATFAVEQDDGGIMYLAKDGDGGLGRVAVPGCVRRPLKTEPATCLRMDAKGQPMDPGELNRFPADEMHPKSTTCQPVACVTMQGEDSDKEEAEMVQDLPGKFDGEKVKGESWR